MVDATALKSVGLKRPCQFESGQGQFFYIAQDKLELLALKLFIRSALLAKPDKSFPCKPLTFLVL